MSGEISTTLLYLPAYLSVCVKFSAIKITNINSLLHMCNFKNPGFFRNDLNLARQKYYV